MFLFYIIKLEFLFNINFFFVSFHKSMNFFCTFNKFNIIIYYWNYPGDVAQELGKYQYYSYEFFTDLINNELWYNYWRRFGPNDYRYDKMNIIQSRIIDPLGLTSSFSMTNYVDTILTLFDNAQST